MSVLVVGSVAFDTLKTPHGDVDKILGGAATHFSLAASFFADTNIVAVVGEDFTQQERRVFEGRSIDLTGLEVAEGQTFRWGGEYSRDMNDRTTLFTELNVFESFRPKIPEKYQDCEYIFLGNIHPELQLEVLDQVKKPRLIAADTMNFWIEGTPEPLAELLKRVDVLLINDAEARQLSGEYNLVWAAEKVRAMGPKILVIKRGEHGVLLFGDGDRFAAPGYPLDLVFDPTGAGDAFGGGFMGYIASRGSHSNEILRQAIIFGSVLGSFGVEDFGTRRLEALTRDQVNDRYREFKRLTHFEDL
jgi:sugar/nucleoside kinase (ribokinase family)